MPLPWRRALAVAAAALLVGVIAFLFIGPRTHYYDPRAGGFTAPVSCVSPWARWTGSYVLFRHGIPLIPNLTITNVPLYEVTVRQAGANAQAVCSSAITGRDHLALTLFIGALVLGGGSFLKPRREPGELVQSPPAISN